MERFYKNLFVVCFPVLAFVTCYGQQTGIIKTERSSPRGIVSFSASSKVTGISDSKHVDGYVEKAGNSIFTFPVGHKGKYRPFAGEADGVTGAYFLENPGSAALPQGGPFLVSSKESNLRNVSTIEFWDIDGTNSSRISLTWNSASSIGALTENSLSMLTIAGWNPTTSRWEKISSSVDEVSLLGGNSSLGAGSITTIQSIIPNTYTIYSLATLTSASTPVNYEGNLEMVSCSEIKGWVWDKNYPDATLTVELVEGNVVYATARADAYRADLKNAGVGTGKYGFVIQTPPSLMDGVSHQLSIRVRGSNALISGSPQVLSCAYDGEVENVDCYVLSGWLRDKNNLDSALSIEVLEGNIVQAVSVANLYRADLKNAGIGTGYYGFAIPLPNSLRDGQSHQLDFRIKGTTYILPNTKILSCQQPVYAGSFEKADCNTINGWVWASNFPNLAFTVELLEGGVVLDTAVAGNYRADLKDAGKGTGKYGFSMALPASIKDGLPHQLSMRVKGTNYVLPGAPRTVTCAVPYQLSGQLEQVDCGVVRGWAWASNYPDSTFTVELLEGSTLLATAVANVYRADLKGSGQGTGNYGFNIALPASLKNGQPHQLSVRIKGSSVILSGSPKTITCATPAQFLGSFEKADCNTVTGWVWASNYPDSTYTVELLEGSVVLGTAVAGNYRADLKDAGKGTGKYGFSMALPASLKNGQAHQLSIRVKGTSYVFPGAARTVTCSTPYQLSGQLEQVDCGVVRGWAWASNYPDSTFTVELLEGGTLLATAVANVYRADLKGSGQGTGNYGFNIALPASLKNGQPHQLSVRIKGSSVILSGSPKTITCATPAQFLGSFEKADCNTVTGWVWASNYPDSTYTVELLEGSVVLGTAIAGNYRADLKDAGKGTGKYGFSMALPASLKNGQAHQLSIRVKGTSYVFPGAARTVTCSTPYQLSGQLEQVDCGVVRGWAWASNYPDSTFTVELLEGSTLLATAVANVYRADLKGSGQGTGNYGFNIALPASLKNGQPHQLSVRIKGSSVILSGSPKTITCATPAQFLGSFEKADCNTVTGWVWASNYPDSTYTVELLEGSVVLGTAVAGNYRADLKDAGKGTGKYGFSMALPASLKNGQAHQLSIRVKGTSYVFPGAARTVTCSTPYQLSGQLEQVDCGVVRGWAWASNYPDSTFTVELLEGSTLLATAVANVYRADLKGSGQGTGNYGFNIALPASLKNGQPHQLSVRIKGSSVILSGAPKTITCATPAQFLGSFEKADCNTVTGWVWASNYPDSTYTVELLEGSVVLGTAVAGNYRADLKDAGKGTGKYGFSMALPASLKNGQAHQLSIRVKGTSYVFPGAARTVTCSTPYQLSGQLEQVDCGVVRGWAWASNYPDSTFTVELLEGGTLLATAVANVYRADLKGSGQGTGNYGFNIALPASLKNGQPHQLSVRIKGSSVILSGSPKTITCATPAQFLGSFEKADCNTVTGWVWASNYPDSTYTVELLEGSVVLGTAVAGNYRADLKDAGKGTGKYGFSMALPASLKNGQAHQLSIRVKGTSYVFPGAARTVTCSTPYQLSGQLEQVDCGVVRGWAWASNYPDSTFTVELLEGGTLLATAVANVYRADLKGSGQGTGNYGFNIALPASLKNGQPHQLSVRIKGSSVILSGSPKTITCATPAQFLGSFEKADCNTVTGWVWASNYPDSTYTVELLEGSVVLGTAVAGNYRADLKDAGKGTGKYGFSMALPASLKNGQAHQLSIRVRGSYYILPGSPKSLACTGMPQLSGNFDAADCSTARGWVWASNYPDSAFTVELLEGNTLLATAEANIYRADLKSAGKGTGSYGFRITLPAALKNGQPRQLSVRVRGSSVILSGSPKTVTCFPSARLATVDEANSILSDMQRFDYELVLAPNPTPGRIAASFRLNQNNKATLSILNAVGNVIAEHVAIGDETGYYRKSFDLAAQSDGVYFIRLKIGGAVDTKRFVLAK